MGWLLADISTAVHNLEPDLPLLTSIVVGADGQPSSGFVEIHRELRGEPTGDFVKTTQAACTDAYSAEVTAVLIRQAASLPGSMRARDVPDGGRGKVDAMSEAQSVEAAAINRELTSILVNAGRDMGLSVVTEYPVPDVGLMIAEASPLRFRSQRRFAARPTADKAARAASGAAPTADRPFAGSFLPPSSQRPPPNTCLQWLRDLAYLRS
jgi:hypothetical protein